MRAGYTVARAGGSSRSSTSASNRSGSAGSQGLAAVHSSPLQLKKDPEQPKQPTNVPVTFDFEVKVSWRWPSR